VDRCSEKPERRPPFVRWIPWITLGLLLGLAWALRSDPGGPEKPEDSIRQFFDAASRGDSKRCLKLCSGELRRSLEGLRQQMARERFEEQLRQTTKGLKGLAIYSPQPVNENTVRIRTELIYADRNEVQQFTVSQEGTGWRITSISSSDTHRPPIAFGTPVFEE